MNRPIWEKAAEEDIQCEEHAVSNLNSAFHWTLVSELRSPWKTQILQIKSLVQILDPDP
jgi:hypothetical protein